MLLPCIVRISDGLVSHEIEVNAESVREAAALGLRELREDGLATATLDEENAQIEVEVRRPPVIHRLTLERLRNWAKSSGSPKSMIERGKIRELLEGPQRQ